MTLVEFLLARIAEDEAAADAGTPVIVIEETNDGPLLGFAQYSRDRILAECDAKRRIIALATAEGEYVAEQYRMNDAAQEVLRLLALAYADHPDYQDKWRP